MSSPDTCHRIVPNYSVRVFIYCLFVFDLFDVFVCVSLFTNIDYRDNESRQRQVDDEMRRPNHFIREAEAQVLFWTCILLQNIMYQLLCIVENIANVRVFLIRDQLASLRDTFLPLLQHADQRIEKLTARHFVQSPLLLRKVAQASGRAIVEHAGIVFDGGNIVKNWVLQHTIYISTGVIDFYVVSHVMFITIYVGLF